MEFTDQAFFSHSSRDRLAFVTGAMVLVGPSAVQGAEHPAAFLRVISAAVENMEVYNLLLLAVVAAMFGFFAHAPAWLLGVATALIFPLWSGIDMALGGSGHNLLPFEWFFYASYAVVAAAVAVIARAVRNFRSSQRGAV